MAFFAGTSLQLLCSPSLGSLVVFLIAIFSSTHRILKLKHGGRLSKIWFSPCFQKKVTSALRVEDAPEPIRFRTLIVLLNTEGLFGEGIGNGLFKLGYLSEVHTDFVLAGIAEG